MLTLCLNTGACGGAPPAEASSENQTLEQAVGFIDRVYAYASAALAKSTGALTTVHKGIFPSRPVPSDVNTLAASFGSESTIMTDYARTQTVRGSELTFQLLLGHRVVGDFDRAVSDFPRKPDGKTASLSSVKPEASRLANTLVTTVERRVAAVTARKTRSKSESLC